MPDSALEIAREKIGKLVATFKANEARYLSPSYQEAEVRKDFIDKFFIALGWDVNHDEQTNPYEQEVKVEPPVQAGGQRRADYAFHLAPAYRIVRFFVEAKKPYGDLATADNYFQTIRYAWNSETPLAVVTDFQQLHILDCRYKPDIATALNRHIARYHYTDFLDPEKFAEIYWLFSREAVAAGSLEKRAKELPKPRGKAVQRGLFPGGYQSIDESFLEELDEYRTALARSFKSKNPSLDGESLTELVQRTLDRLVFIRFLEDKGIEPQRIIDRFGDSGTPWEDFVTASRRLDSVYNGIVFKRHALLDGDHFHTDEAAFADICKRLAHVNSPYDFDAIPIHILGSIYERFLGNVIVTTDKRAQVEPKPEVRKAGGVYYTPEYIVRYIVGNTVGKLIADKAPDQIAEMRFADVACGSGSFLLGVFEMLLTYHGQYYNDNPKKARKGDCVVHDGKLYLSLRKKREILLNNIFGVDIDAQAVEVCQLSLYLRLLKDETTGSTHQHLLEFAHIAQMKKLLPDLSKNIICGNSLIGSDILESQLFPSDEERKINSLDFEDAFPEVMRRGGFDSIVGNPPWLMAGYYLPSSLNYLRQKFRSAQGKFDLYYLFIEQACGLLSDKGLFGMIVPNKFFHTKAASGLRTSITERRWVRGIVDFGDEQLFSGATNYSCILFLAKQRGPGPEYAKATAGLNIVQEFTVPWSSLGSEPWHFADQPAEKLFKKLKRRGRPLEEITKRFGTGVQTGADRLLTVEAETARDNHLESELLRPLLRGRDVRRYAVSANPRLLIFPYKVQDDEFEILPDSELQKYKHVYQVLSEHKSKLATRVWFGKNARELSGKWYGMMYLDSFGSFEAPHILTPSLSDGANFALGERNLFVTGTAGITSIIPEEGIHEDIRYLLGVLNSSLINFYVVNHSPIFSGGFHKFSAPYLRKIPIRTINFSDTKDKTRHNDVVTRVNAMLEARRRLLEAKSEKDQTYYRGRCDALDRQIDQLVYDLYGLTAEEIEIVEQRS
jgi:type I restriction-modification system DNA methylase subunit